MNVSESIPEESFTVRPVDPGCFGIDENRCKMKTSDLGFLRSYGTGSEPPVSTVGYLPFLYSSTLDTESHPLEEDLLRTIETGGTGKQEWTEDRGQCDVTVGNK